MNDPQSNIDAGERLRDEGMELAANANPCQIRQGKIAFITALLEMPGNVGTIDDATNKTSITTAFADGGKWRGSVTRSLAKSGYIEKVDVVESRRVSRHCGHVTRWRLKNPSLARFYAMMLITATELDEIQSNEATPSAGTDGAAIPETPQTTDEGTLK
jgi:hypothetical protein